MQRDRVTGYVACSSVRPLWASGRRMKQLGCGALTRIRPLSSLAPVSDLLQQLEEHEPLCLGQVPHDLSIGLEQCRECL